MKASPTHPLTPAQREALEARFALRLSARLEEGAQAIPHDISERLRVAREQALRAAREARVAATAPAVVAAPAVNVTVAGLSAAGAGGAGNVSRAHRGSQRSLEEAPTSWRWRLAAALPLLALVAGLWGIQRYYHEEQVQAATEVDMALLTDDLPPAAYADPGFAEFLREDTGPTVRPLDQPVPEADGDLRSADTTPASSTP